MPGTWDSERYRMLEAKWREEAEVLQSGQERNACLVLADGYARLVAIIDRLGDDTDIWPELIRVSASPT